LRESTPTPSKKKKKLPQRTKGHVIEGKEKLKGGGGMPPSKNAYFWKENIFVEARKKKKDARKTRSGRKGLRKGSLAKITSPKKGKDNVPKKGEKNDNPPSYTEGGVTQSGKYGKKGEKASCRGRETHPGKILWALEKTVPLNGPQQKKKKGGEKDSRIREKRGGHRHHGGRNPRIHSPVRETILSYRRWIQRGEKGSGYLSACGEGSPQKSEKKKANTGKKGRGARGTIPEKKKGAGRVKTPNRKRKRKGISGKGRGIICDTKEICLPGEKGNQSLASRTIPRRKRVRATH